MIKNLCLAFMLTITPLQSILADNNVEALIKATMESNLEHIKLLVEKGTSIKVKNIALMIASGAQYLLGFNGNLEIVKYLASKGACINAIAAKNVSMTALDFAEIAENYDIAEFLRKAGAKSLLNGTQFAMLRQEVQVLKQVLSARSDELSITKAIVAKVFANNINTKSPKAPNGKLWGKWIIEIGELDTDRWAVSSNGIYLKDCNNKTPLIWINPKTGNMHFNPSKLNDDKNFVKS